MKLLQGLLAVLLMLSLAACNPFAAISDAASAIENAAATNTASNVSCNTGYTSAGSAQCITYTSTNPVTSCYSGSTQVSSCSGAYRCVYDGLYTFYYVTYTSSAQTYCTNSGGTWY